MKSKPKLNSDCVQKADAALYAAHPELKGRKLSSGPEDAALRRTWLQNYQKAANAKSPAKPGSNSIKGSTLQCRPTTKLRQKSTVPKGSRPTTNKESKTVPCNLVSFELTDESSGRSVKMNAPGPTPPSKLPKSPFKRALANSNLMVLEVLSDFPVTGSSKSKKEDVATIAANLICEAQCGEHPTIYARISPSDVTAGDALKESTTSQGKLPSLKTFAKTIPMDFRTGKFQWNDIRDFFHLGEDQVKELRIEGITCGVPAGKGQPCSSLMGLVRVYRREQFDLSLTIPAFRKWEESREGSKKAGEEWEMTGTKSRGSVSTEATWKAGGPIDEVTETKRTSVLFEKSVNNSREEGVSEESKRKLKFSLQRNGVDLEAAKIIEEIIQQTKDVTENVMEAITSFEDCVPKIGFSASASFSLLEGSLTMSWGNRPDPAFDSQSYKWIGPFGELALDVDVVKLELELMFGIDFSSPDILNWAGNKAYEFIAKLELDASLALKLGTKVTLWGGADDDADEGERTIVKGEVPASIDLYAQAKASVYGFGLEAQGGLEAGLDAEATFVIPPKLKYKVDLRPGTVYGYWSHPFKSEPSPRYEFKIWDERELCKGSFPGEAKQSGTST
jgi:hypothetical protein